MLCPVVVYGSSLVNHRASERFPSREKMMAEKYRPSNGTAGIAFDDQWCSNCERDRAWREDDKNDPCQILSNTMIYNVDDPEYPAEWIYGADGRPCCTAFVKIKDPAFDAELEAALADPRQIPLL